MFFNEILYATQYYRAPTPLPDEWEEDLSKLQDIGLDTIQIRINWRWNERRENEYDFSDVDRLMELAEKYDKKVIVKFLLECAPQYIFDKYDGFRVGSKGEKLGAGANGAFYGGWRPCFTNPYVQKRAVKFVEKVAQRYKDRKNLIFWNAWNEIRNKPVEDCFCPHCRAAFGKYLQKKFDTIEALNAFYGTAEESFESIALPTMSHAYWDIFEFKKFKGGEELYNWLQFVYKAIRKHDAARPIMAHAGCTSAFQDHLCDVCDDKTVAKGVDFWGTSIPVSCAMDTQTNRLDFFLLLDFIRSVDKNYFLYEIYPGLGMFKPDAYDTDFDMRFKLYAGLACGTKGFNYWQYRAERLGNESDCAGLARANGEPRSVCREVKSFGELLKARNEEFCAAEVAAAEVAIVFDFDSLLLCECEEHATEMYAFKRKSAPAYYKHAHIGMYELLNECDYNVDYVHVDEPEKFRQYKVLYFPYHAMLGEKTAKYLQEFVKEGGVVILDEGFGSRQPNTWWQPYDIACKPMIRACLTERRETLDEELVYKGERLKLAPFKSEYRAEDAEVLLSFADGAPALQKFRYGKGTAYLFGSSIGYSYKIKGSKGWKTFVADLLEAAGVHKNEYSDVENFVYEKRLVCGDKEILFLFNCSEEEKTFMLRGGVYACGADGKLDGDRLVLPPDGVAYVVKAL